MLKYLGAELRRFYDAAVRRPLSWRMIDTLVSLEEMSEKERERVQQPDGSAPPEQDGNDAGGARK